VPAVVALVVETPEISGLLTAGADWSEHFSYSHCESSF
jgi:hypothetical protein